MLDPGGRGQRAPRPDVGASRRAARGRREGEGPAQRGGEDQARVAAAGDGHDARAPGPVGQRAQPGHERVRRRLRFEPGPQQPHDRLRVQQLRALLDTVGPQAQDGPARQPAHGAPQRVPGQRPAAAEQAGERERVQLARARQRRQRGRRVGEPARAVRVGREQRVRAECVGAHLQLAGGVVVASRRPAPIERIAPCGRGRQVGARIERTGAVGLAAGAVPADRTSREQGDPGGLGVDVLDAADLRRIVRHPGERGVAAGRAPARRRLRVEQAGAPHDVAERGRGGLHLEAARGPPAQHELDHGAGA